MKQQNSIYAQFLVFVFCIIGFATFTTLVKSTPQLPSQSSVNQLIEVYRAEVHPEGMERFIFTLAAVFVPLLAYFLALQSDRKQWWHDVGTSGVLCSVWRNAPSICAFIFFIPFIGTDFLSLILGTSHRLSPFIILVATTFLVWQFRHHLTLNIMDSTAWVWIVFISSALLQLLSWRLLGINSVNDDNAQWRAHMDALTYALSQVAAGKTILVDLPSQYGLWPELSAPLLKLTGLSVIGITSAFGVLQIGSLTAVFFVLNRLIKLPVLKLTSAAALVMCTFGTSLLFSSMPDPYFQYWPIRFIWPALSVFAFYKFASNKSIARSALVSLTGAIGILWNLDTGLFIVISFGAFLLARIIAEVVKGGREMNIRSQWKVRDYGVAVLLHIVVTIAIVALFFGTLMLKSGSSLNWIWLYKYQSIFYELGFMMMPLPLKPHPWMAILGVYLLGLMITFRQWIMHPSKSSTDTVFYLCILGLGLFFYYQGRSHVLNLMSVCWPALLVATILSDKVLRGIKAGLLPASSAYLPIIHISLLLICCLSFLTRAPMMFDRAKLALSTRDIPVAPYVANEIDFISTHSIQQRECFILSKRQGIYYAETGLASPISGPGLVETILVEDQTNLVRKILTGKVSCLFVGIGEHTRAEFDFNADLLKLKYRHLATNSINTMQYWQPITEDQRQDSFGSSKIDD